MLGPDILAPELDEQRFLRRLREDDPTRADRRRPARPAHDRRHRQPLEGRGLLSTPRSTRGAPTGEVSDDEALAIVHAARPRMQESARSDGHQTRAPSVYGASACRARAAAHDDRSRGQGDDNRMTYWCPGCQH